jgi:hemerythrin
MPLIQWNDRYSVGVRSLDAQHRQLINVLNRLHEAMSTAQARQALPVLMQELGSYATAHLQAEEQLLRSQQYPDFVQHKAQHDAYIAKVKELQEQVAQNASSSVAIVLINFLKQWWTKHILETDKQYSQFLKSKGVN